MGKVWTGFWCAVNGAAITMCLISGQTALGMFNTALLMLNLFLLYHKD